MADEVEKFGKLLKAVEDLADIVEAIARRVDYLDGDLGSVFHDLGVLKETLGAIGREGAPRS